MLKLTPKDYEEVRLWMHRNAREIELSLWRFYFENGSKADILKALALYQNEDGGFGHTLEPDCWNPNSSPYTTLTAMTILDKIGFTDTSHSIWLGILNYLDSGVYYDTYGWQFSIPSNNDYPHAPWWTYDAAANTFQSIGLSAEIAAQILKYSGKESPLYKKALKETERLFGLVFTGEKHGDMGIGGYAALLDAINKAGLTAKFDMTPVSARVRDLVNSTIVRDTTKWEQYGARPSNFITSPDSPYYSDNRDIVETELDYLIKTRPAAGVWGITWSWFDNNEKYAKAFAVSENWWKANLAVSKMLMLRNFGRLE